MDEPLKETARSRVLINLVLIIIAMAGISFQLWDFATTLERRMTSIEFQLKHCSEVLKKIQKAP